jgi:multicomponent Na+:H+ antiporter subunit E
MRQLFWNVALAFIWAAINGSYTVADLALGFLIGYVVIMLADAEPLPGPYARKVARLVHFSGFYIYELVLSSLRVAMDVLTPRQRARPAILAIPLEPGQSDGRKTLLANLITMTPGTMSLDLEGDTLYVHAMFADDPEAARDDLKRDFERRVQGLMR